MTGLNFPKLREKRTELQRIFAEAGEDYDLSKVTCIPGAKTNHDKLAHVRQLNDEIEELERIEDRAHKVRSGVSGYSEAGTGFDSARRSGGVDYGTLQRLGKQHSVTSWVKARAGGSGDFDTDAAWDAYAKGLVLNDWQPWLKDFASKAMSTAEPGGGYLVPDELSSSVIDRMRALTPIFQAGATSVPMAASTLDIARVTGDPTTAWHSESAAITPSDVTLDRVRFTARTLPVIVKVSRELAEDAPNLGTVVQQAIGGAIGVETTRVALRGSGTAPEPTGIANTAGIGTTAVGGAADWSTLLTATGDIAARNGVANGYITAPRTATALEGQTGSDGHFVMPPPTVANLGRFQTSVIPINLGAGSDTEVYVGDFTMLLVGMRTALRIETLTERYADTGEYAFMAWVRLDIQLEQPAAFQLLTGVSN